MATANLTTIEGRIKKDLEKAAKERAKLLLEPTKDWKNHHPTSQISAPYKKGGNLAIDIEIVGSSAPHSGDSTTDSEVYSYLNFGTSKRHAVMTRGFVPKTKVRHFMSNPGVGKMSYINMSKDYGPIKARMWIDEAEKMPASKGGGGVVKVIAESAMVFLVNKIFDWVHPKRRRR